MRSALGSLALRVSNHALKVMLAEGGVGKKSAHAKLVSVGRKKYSLGKKRGSMRFSEVSRGWRNQFHFGGGGEATARGQAANWGGWLDPKKKS